MPEEDFKLHAPIMNGLPPEELLPHMLTAIDAAAILGARWVVVHPVTLPQWAGRDALDEECVRTNQRYFTELVDAATARGVGIAVENMFKGRFGMKSSELLVLLQQFPEEAFGVCWDTSHGELSSPNQAEEMALVKSRIVATHISDNLGQADDHLYPYRGQVDWAAVVGVLREQPWVLNFEVPGEMSRCPLELRGALVEYGFAVGKHLLNL